MALASETTIVVKIGGSTLGQHDTTLQDLAGLQKKGITPIVVHGGGKAITQWLDKQGIPTRFARGLRVTDAASLQVVVAVLAGLVNKELVAAINAQGGKAVGLSGADGNLIRARVQDKELGFVGEVTKIDPGPIIALVSQGYMPVIAPIGCSNGGGSGLLNINADTVAAELAVAVGAGRLIYLTDVPGVGDSDGKVMPDLSQSEVKEMVESGVISGGMIPKVEACLRSLEVVKAALIVDGRLAHSLMESVSGKVLGTRIRRE